MASENQTTPPQSAAAVPGAASIPGAFKESHRPLAREELLKRRIGELKLQLDSSAVGRLTRRLYDELAHVGLSYFHPPVYLSDEWGCPDRVPIIGVPFYLADPELTRLEDEFMEGVEAESDEEILRLLRHEAGHALNYAYRLYDQPEWTALFGPFLRPYPDDYTPNPFSRSYVRHLPGWYAQKHPDEDFAETFAVWLDPQSNWGEVYADWSCVAKLLYVDRTVRGIGSQPPPITAENYDTQEEYLSKTIAEHYHDLGASRVEIPRLFDAALKDIFSDQEGESNTGMTAEEFLQRHRRKIVRSVFHWTGLNDDVVRAVVAHFEERSAALQLQSGSDQAAKLIEVVALVTTLCMNRLQTGEFVQK